MKRTLSLILILTMLLSLAACGSKDAAPADDDNAPSQEQGGREEQSGGTTGTPDEPEQPEQTQPTEQEPADSKPKQEPAGEPEKEPARQPEQKPNPKPAEKPAEGTSTEPPTETPKPETPAEDKPAAAVDDALTILNAIWNTYSDEEKFPAAGGDSEHAVDGAPGSFDVSNADSLSYLLTFPADDVSLIDSAASLVHMMNLNTFTCGAFHVADANNVARLADDLRTTIQAKHWMCGFPDKLVIVTVGQSVLSVYGNEELVNTFRDKLLASYSAATAVYDEAINA
ncbi:MAG: hypothetical protein SPI98_06365 [Oscillospiraceae bacterium]|nr:hypothetical protein [Oscillospiraceae bacterium]